VVHEIGIINGGKVFNNSGNVFQIGRLMFYERKNKIPIKITGKKKVWNQNNCEILWNSEQIFQPSHSARPNLSKIWAHSHQCIRVRQHS
jgi:hypothetical protein